MKIVNNKPSKIAAMKNFWDRKKGAIAITATATTVGLVVIMRAQQKTVDKFLQEHDLQEEFWKFIGADREEIEEFRNNSL
jgi:hypothetical protein